MNLSEPLEQLADKIRQCRLCPLWKGRTIAVPGEGRPDAELMLIGEAPGRKEDESGRPFCGAAGKVLTEVLTKAGFNREDVFITSVCKCRPPENRLPKSLEVDTCVANYLSRQIETINPKIIVVMGLTAARKLLGLNSLEGNRGKFYPKDGREYFVSYHPACVLYQRKMMPRLVEDFKTLKTKLTNPKGSQGDNVTEESLM